MYFKDHLPPHFHAEYGGQEAQFSIETGNVIVGDLPRKQVRLIQAWVELYREELVELRRVSEGQWKTAKDQAVTIMNPRIKEILSIKPFVIKSLWTDGQVRVTDFGKFLAEYEGNSESMFGKLLQPATFTKAKTDGRTILWENLTEIEDYDGTLMPAPLDFCPDVLFENSTLA